MTYRRIARFMLEHRSSRYDSAFDRLFLVLCWNLSELRYTMLEFGLASVIYHKDFIVNTTASISIVFNSTVYRE